MRVDNANNAPERHVHGVGDNVDGERQQRVLRAGRSVRAASTAENPADAHVPRRPGAMAATAGPRGSRPRPAAASNASGRATHEERARAERGRLVPLARPRAPPARRAERRKDSPRPPRPRAPEQPRPSAWSSSRGGDRGGSERSPKPGSRPSGSDAVLYSDAMRSSIAFKIEDFRVAGILEGEEHQRPRLHAASGGWCPGRFKFSARAPWIKAGLCGFGGDSRA